VNRKKLSPIKIVFSFFGRNLDKGIILLIPAILIMAFVSLYPTIFSFIMGFFSWRWGSNIHFVFLENYIRYLTDASFWKIVGHTLYFTVGAVSIELVLGLLLALMVSKMKMVSEMMKMVSGILSTILMLPLMVSGIIVALTWKILLDPSIGIVNYFLSMLGLPMSAWFGSRSMAMPSIIMVDVWWQTSFVFIVLFAGLQSLPIEPYEAADVDGDTSFQKFRYVTLPMLKPVIFVVLMFRTIDCLKVFDIIFGTTGGGPGSITETIQPFTYRTMFKYMHLGRSMSLMVIFSLMILVIILVYLRFSRTESEK